MELLLNLVWLLLAVPAYWLWRASEDIRYPRRFSAVQVLLALTCVLVLLFPVISATDDLHAMRAEVEESPSTKRNVRQAPTDRASAVNIHSQTLQAIGETFALLAPLLEWTDVSARQTSSVLFGPALPHVGRAPPLGRPA